MTVFPKEVHLAHPTRLEDIKPGQHLEAILSRMGTCPNCGDRDGLMYFFRIAERGGTIRKWIDSAGASRLVRTQMEVYACPVCNATARVGWLVTNSGLEGLELEGRKALDLRLATCHPRKEQEKAWQAATGVLQEIPKPSTWALFFGPNGTGKTHVLVSMVNACRVADLWAHYTTMENMLRRLRACYGPEAVQPVETIRAYFETCPALAIDELDRVQWTDWAAETAFAIIENRHAVGLVTWFGSNLLPSELRAKDRSLEAIVSRISAGMLVGMTGPDLRPSQPELPEWVHA